LIASWRHNLECQTWYWRKFGALVDPTCKLRNIG
jgi:hypothetical protein